MSNNKINLDKEIGNIDLNDLDLIKKEVENEEKQDLNQDTDSTNESDLLSELSKYADEATEKLKQREEDRKKQIESDKQKKEQSKYIIIGTILAILLCFSFIFSGCTKSKKHHKHTPANKTRGHKEFSGSKNNNYFNESGSTQASPMGPTKSGFEANPM